MKSGKKLQKVVISGESWRKVAKSGKSVEKYEIVVK